MSQLDATPQRAGGFALHASVVLVLLALTRWWSHAEFLLNSDAVNYVRALEVFDLASYSPHPPGYVLFVLAGRAVNAIVNDGNLTYLIVIWICQAITSILTLRFLREFLTPFPALLGTMVVLFHPLFWYYGSMTSVYSAEAATVLVLARLALGYSREPRRIGAMTLGLALGLAGGVRQFTILFTLPAFAVVFLHVRRRSDLWPFIAGAIAGLLLWIVPLMTLAGGWDRYNAASTEFFAHYLESQAPLFSGNFKGAFYNVLLWFTAMFLLLWPMLPLVSIYLLKKPWRSRPDDHARFLGRFWMALIAAPALFYLLVHIGQPGYVVGMLCPAFIAVAHALITRTKVGLGIVTASFVACACLGGLVFAFAPAPASQYVTTPDPGFYRDPKHWATLGAKLYKFQADFTYHGLRKWEGVNEGYLAALSQFPQDSTLSLYVQDREVSAFLWEYYTVENSVLYNRWPKRVWTCRGGLCHEVVVDTSQSDVVRIQLSAQIRYVFVIDDRLLEYNSHRLHTQALDPWGKAPLVLTAPQTASIDGLRISWGQ